MNDTMIDRSAVLVREHNDRAWLAWTIEGLRRTKKLPRLDRLLVKPPRAAQSPATTPKQQYDIMERWRSVMNRLGAQ